MMNKLFNSPRRIIMKLAGTALLVFHFSISYSQWTMVQQLPETPMITLYHKGDTIYVGGENIIYFSRDRGQTWDSTTNIPQLTFVTSIVVFKNELYAASPGDGVFKSPDGGITWQDVSAGIFPQVGDFCEFNGELFAATLGNSVYKLDPVTGNSWVFFSNGLSNLSVNLPTIASNSKAVIAGTLANGIYAHLPANSTTWEERLLTGQIDPNEGAYDIVTGHDTLFYSGHTGKFYMSTDNGLNWSFIGNKLPSAATTMVNAKQAIVVTRHIIENGGFKTHFNYIKKDSLQDPFVNFSEIISHFSYRIDIVGDKLWDASSKGLFYMSLSDLPGITAADDTAPVALPVRFISFNVNCDKDKVLINWKTAQEQNSSHFNIERSADSVNWVVIGNQPATGNSSTERSYSYTDNDPLQNGYYRIAEYDLDGRVQYSWTLRSICSVDEFRMWPNPVHDKLFTNITSNNVSKATIKLLDSKGSVVKIQAVDIVQGSNQLDIDMKHFPNGIYVLLIDWNNGQDHKAVQLLKQ